MPVDRDLDALAHIEKTIDEIFDEPKIEPQPRFPVDNYELIENWFVENDDGYGHLLYKQKEYKIKRGN